MTANAAGRRVLYSKAVDFRGSLAKGLPLLVGLSWLGLLPVVIPNLREDRGVFVSVAERLLAGDTLYLDVWDNKDPLFYYTIAAGRLVSPYVDILLELLWLFTAGAAATMIARWRGCDGKIAVFTGFVLTPIILTGGMYIAGMTHLPGTAVALMAMAVTLLRKYTMVGILLALLAFLKIVMLPVSFMMVIAVVLTRRKMDGLVRAAAGFVVAGGLVALVLQIRGELFPYLRSLVLNVSYSQGSQDVAGLPSMVDHLLRVLSLPLLLMLTTFFVGLIILLKERRKGQDSASDSRTARTLWVCQLWALGTGIAVLATTGMWHHHGQVLYAGAVLLTIDLASYLQWHIIRKPGVTVVGFLCFSLLLSGTAGPWKYYESVTTMDESVAGLTEPSPETISILSIAPQGNYARVGQNYDGGHAFGLHKWNLMCARFHQYPFDSSRLLQDTVECLKGAEVILVDASAVPIPGQEKWNAYLEQVNALLDAGYVCSQDQEKACRQR
jgi:hypothetical protein